MKIALISPRGKVSNDKKFMDFWSNSMEIAPYREAFTGFSTGLLIIASLTPKTWKIDLIDENINPVDFYKKYDIVAIGAMTQQATRAYQIADAFRKTGAKVIIGGIHATLLPEEAKMHADSIVIGEAESIWSQVLEDFCNNILKPFYKNDKLTDFTKTPIPRYELLDVNKYKVVWVQASRGCPMDCEFCCASNVYGHRYRYKDVSQVIKEIKAIVNQWGRNILISFADDNMFVNKKFANILITSIKDLKIRWFAQTDISIIENKKLLTELKNSGCSMLFIGFESLNYKNLKPLNRNAWKANYLNRYSEIIQRIQSYGIGVMGSFIIGFDEDLPDTFKDMSRFIIENNIFASQISILTPLPGTRLRSRLLKENRVLNRDWDNYTFANVNFIPKKISAAQLQKAYLNIYKQIYSSKVRLKKAIYFKKIYLNIVNEVKN